MHGPAAGGRLCKAGARLHVGLAGAHQDDAVPEALQVRDQEGLRGRQALPVELPRQAAARAEEDGKNGCTAHVCSQMSLSAVTPRCGPVHRMMLPMNEMPS
eukprot:5158159-Prymnesium_polylepis.1